jgi:hypothetical protein
MLSAMVRMQWAVCVTGLGRKALNILRRDAISKDNCTCKFATEPIEGSGDSSEDILLM